MENDCSLPGLSAGPRLSEGDYSPVAALADAAAIRERVVDRLVTPWWYHPALGAIQTCVCLSLLLPATDMARPIRLGTQFAILFACCVGIGALVRSYRRLTGLWVSRPLGRRSRALWSVYAVFVVAACILCALGASSDRAWIVAATVLPLVFVVTALVGPRMDRALRAEIRSGLADVREARG